MRHLAVEGRDATSAAVDEHPIERFVEHSKRAPLRDYSSGVIKVTPATVGQPEGCSVTCVKLPVSLRLPVPDGQDWIRSKNRLSNPTGGSISSTSRRRLLAAKASSSNLAAQLGQEARWSSSAGSSRLSSTPVASSARSASNRSWELTCGLIIVREPLWQRCLMVASRWVERTAHRLSGATAVVNIPVRRPRPRLLGLSELSAGAPARSRSSADDQPHVWRDGRAQIAPSEILMGCHCELARMAPVF